MAEITYKKSAITEQRYDVGMVKMHGNATNSMCRGPLPVRVTHIHDGPSIIHHRSSVIDGDFWTYNLEFTHLMRRTRLPTPICLSQIVSTVPLR